MKSLIVLMLMSLTAPALASDGLKDALQQALENSDHDHQKQQEASQVSPEQMQKALLKRRHAQIIEVPVSLEQDEAGDVHETVNLAGAGNALNH